MGKLISSSKEGRGGSYLVTGSIPTSSPFAGLQERLWMRYKATPGPASTIPHLSELPPMLFLAPVSSVLVGMSAAGKRQKDKGPDRYCAHLWPCSGLAHTQCLHWLRCLTPVWASGTEWVDGGRPESRSWKAQLRQSDRQDNRNPMKTGGDSHTRSDLQGGLEARRKQTPEDGCGGRGTCSLNFSVRHRCGQETARLAGGKRESGAAHRLGVQ